MSEQAIYDAVRSRITACNVGDVLREAALSAFDMSYPRQIAQHEIGNIGMEMVRPSVLFRPRVFLENPKTWCALYGEDLQQGVAGFGETPDAAMRDFDKNWTGR